MAEVFAYGEGRVVKLDRPEWSGVSAFESDVITKAAEAGLPVARSHGVVTIDDRCGVVLDRIHGRELTGELLDAGDAEVALLAARFVDLQMSINRTHIAGLPDLVSRLAGELAHSGLAAGVLGQLTGDLAALNDGRRGVCHFDFHPGNVMVSGDEWVVIDWLGVASGPPAADLARTLVLCGQWTDPPIKTFMEEVRRLGLSRHGIDDHTCDSWVRVLAGARLAEGFGGEFSAWLHRVAEGEVRLFA